MSAGSVGLLLFVSRANLREIADLRDRAAVPLRQLLEHLAVLAIATVFHEVTVAICSEAYRRLS